MCLSSFLCTYFCFLSASGGVLQSSHTFNCLNESFLLLEILVGSLLCCRKKYLTSLLFFDSHYTFPFYCSKQCNCYSCTGFTEGHGHLDDRYQNNIEIQEHSGTQLSGTSENHSIKFLYVLQVMGVPVICSLPIHVK